MDDKQTNFEDIDAAFAALIESQAFKALAKNNDSTGSRLRRYKSRFEGGDQKQGLGLQAKIATLMEFDAEITITLPAATFEQAEPAKN